MGEIRFVGTGETRGYPYLVCKKFWSEPFTHCSNASQIPILGPCYASHFLPNSQVDLLNSLPSYVAVAHYLA